MIVTIAATKNPNIIEEMIRQIFLTYILLGAMLLGIFLFWAFPEINLIRLTMKKLIAATGAQKNNKNNNINKINPINYLLSDY